MRLQIAGSIVRIGLRAFSSLLSFSFLFPYLSLMPVIHGGSDPIAKRFTNNFVTLVVSTCLHMRFVLS